MIEVDKKYNIIDDTSLTPEQQETVKKIRIASFNRGYEKHIAEEQVNKRTHDLYVARLVREAYKEGVEESITKLEQRVTKTQPYTIESKIGISYSLKGECNPYGHVTISRHLETGDAIMDLIHADLSQSVEELMTAVSEIQKRAEVK